MWEGGEEFGERVVRKAFVESEVRAGNPITHYKVILSGKFGIHF